MGFLDKARAQIDTPQNRERLLKLRGSVADAVAKNEAKIGEGLDKAAAAADKRTKGKYQGRIAQGVAGAKKGVSYLGRRPDGGTSTSSTAKDR
ncbi:Rv0909 family putative TA system antitoxin [Nocardioides sp. GY 10127]|uniref:Rv0909 family putative TA system antitoxin n=1 Tax=Nocardioides sp. GY 10127 TaxID=2569762 RepID=UPI0010A8CC4A|nr:Rv0909 family putative TA system antitoxin [Nocardioides sp. GY 10127]TIC84477.1 antitoxin [Nocardioides sp. GY 10127]